MQSFTALSLANLEALGDGLTTGRIDPTDAAVAVQRIVHAPHAAAVIRHLGTLAASGMRADHIAHVVRAIVAERKSQRDVSDRLSLVWTVGRDTRLARGRQTAAIVRELFQNACERVVVTSYSIDDVSPDEPDRHPFAELAKRMDAMPSLDVRIALNIGRTKRSDDRPPAALIDEFRNHFVRNLGPGDRLPHVFFHPRGPDRYERTGRACLHAKCIVVDGAKAFVTSANFSGAAHERNVELGVCIDDPKIAAAIEEELDELITAGVLVPLRL